MRYFVKPHFSGWHEVTENQYVRFINNIRTGASAMTESQKQQLIERVTRTEPEDSDNAAREKEKENEKA